MSCAAIPASVHDNWQSIVDLLVRVAGVRACLVNRALPEELEICQASDNEGNPYRAGMREPLGLGVYCESVLRRGEAVLVADSQASDEWRDNPDAVAFGMVSYLGFPILWPDGRPFGTLCLLDNKANEYSADAMAMVEKMRDLIEGNLGLLEEARLQRLFAGDSVIRRMLDNLPTPVSCASLGSGMPILYLNQAFVETFGYAAADLPTVEAWLALAYPDETEHALVSARWQVTVDRACTLGETPEPNNVTVTCKDGRVLDVLISAALVDDMLLVSFTDITVQKSSEERLRVAIDQMEATMSASPDLMFRVDREGRILEAHTAEDQRFYVPKDRFLGRNAQETLPPDSAEVVERALDEAVATGSHRGAVYRLPLGELDTWWELSISAVGGLAGPREEFVLLARDVTARHEAEEALRRRVAELDVLRRMAELLVHRVDLTEALHSVRELLLTLFDACAVDVRLVHDEFTAGFDESDWAMCGFGAEDASEAMLAAALADAELVTAAADGFHLLALPLLAQGETVGALVVTRPDEAVEYTVEEQALAQTAGDLLAGVLRLERLRAEEKQEAAGEERRRIARDLHDAVTQSIHSARMLAEALPVVWERDPDQGRADMLAIRRLIRAAFAELRIMLYELRPETLAAASVETLFERLHDAFSGKREATMELTVEPGLTLPQDVRLTLYRVAQEALNNVAKYARAAHAAVSVVRDGDGVRLTVTDDGSGFDVDASPDGMGLAIMRERAEEIGAQLSVDGTPGAGTTVTLIWRPRMAGLRHLDPIGMTE